MTTERYVCIHGHFYQPPRENPWLEAIERQDSAYPYHDWNERIAAECYAPNGASRILDGEGCIVELVNNYARMSFNVGPTLLAWLEAHAPETCAAILQADRESRDRFGGHGSAIAQVYNHVIMPLANRRDKVTQVAWGIADFRRRFGRLPEGMWLAETAADLETLEVLAERGIRFTILAPTQARRVRPLAGGAWRDATGGRIDPTMAYRQRLPSGRTIDLFFYDGPISRAVAFEGLLDRGERLAERLLGGFDDARRHPQLVHIATDGESYGHHHRHGDMALAYALRHIEEHGLARLTTYGEFLERHPPTHQVEIVEGAAWSCTHGVGRWREDCGCNSGGRPAWNQAWRAPLRAALDWLRDALIPLFEERARAYVTDPWAARDDYIELVLDRSPEAVERFLARHTFRGLNGLESVALWQALEMQRQALLMYTSCGWFFDELSGIETVQIIQYAGRAVQLAEALGGVGIEAGFVERLAAARSNLAEHGDGAAIYARWVKPAAVDHEQVAAHYAISSLFDDYPARATIYCYEIDRAHEGRRAAGRARLIVGRARLVSRITGEAGEYDYGALDYGDHTVAAGVRPASGEAAFHATADQLFEAFDRGDLPDVIRRLDRQFGEQVYTLRSLFRDEQRAVVRAILDSQLTADEALFRQIYEQRAPTARFLDELGVPLPPTFQTAAGVILNLDLRRAVEADPPDPARVRELLEQAGCWRVALDTAGLAYALAASLRTLARRFRARPADLTTLEALTAAAGLARGLPFEVDLWQPQNDCVAVVGGVYAAARRRAAFGDEAAEAWMRRLRVLAGALGVKVDEMDEAIGPTAAELAEALRARRRIPLATYRLQFQPGFTFDDARALVAYLADLGVSDLYASPIFAAAAGSAHGYDVIDYGRLNPELGGGAGFAALSAELRARGMGLLLDMVPNHMGIADNGNAWWQDVLENGPGAVAAPCFDIEWRPVTPELENRVLLPILEDQYGLVLEAGKLRLAYEAGAFFVGHYEARLPVAPRAYRAVLRHALPALIEQLGPEHEHVLELQSIITALNYLPVRTKVDPPTVAERNREKEIIKRRLAALTEASPAVAEALAAAVRAINGTVGDPASFDALDRLLDAQAYRLAYWRVATDEINYRRFFDINHLAAIRVERPAVFDATHRLVYQLLAEGMITGLRIDHPDGLWDPADYFRKVQAGAIRAWLAAEDYHPDLIDRVIAWFAERTAGDWPLFVVAEKILSEREELPPDWAIAGTTGYDFLNLVNGLFVDGRNQKLFDKVYSHFIGGEVDFGNLVNTTKKLVMLVSLASEVNALSHRLERIAEQNRRFRDLTLTSLTFALREVIASLGVYRTYVTGPEDAAAPFNQAHIAAAVADARRRNPRTAASIFDFVQDTLLLRNLGEFPEAARAELVDFVMRFQQITGPVMAKGVEDTAFYRYHRLASLNEVGGHPAQFGVSVAAFHRANAERRERWPHALLATATHDTKRSEDVRARLDVLSELPEEWRAALGRWARLNAAGKAAVDGAAAPDRNDEYLLYQTLIGAWPEPWGESATSMTAGELAAFQGRIDAYLLKAVREAKVHTSWINPNTAYEAALAHFIRRLLGDHRFVDDVRAVARRIAGFGEVNGLAQALLKLTAPGAPDIYQGAELWDFSLVDPDNRRPVDFDRRRALLADLRQREASDGFDRLALASELLATAADGRVKLYLIARALACRRDHPSLFADGDYLPLEVIGARRDHVCAFARRAGEEALVVVVPRLVVGLTGGDERPPRGEATWGDTTLTLPRAWADRRLEHLLTGELVDATADGERAGLGLARACAHFPVALLKLGPEGA